MEEAQSDSPLHPKQRDPNSEDEDWSDRPDAEDISSLTSSLANLFAGVTDVKNKIGTFDSLLRQILANPYVSASSNHLF